MLLSNSQINTEVLELLKKGDKKAFALLYDEYSPSIYGILLKIIKDPQIAEEVLQNVFVTIFSKIKDFNQEKESLFLWIYNISREMAINSVDASLEEKTKEIKLIFETNPLPLLELIYFRGYTMEAIIMVCNIPKETLQKGLREELRQFIKKQQINE